MSSQFTLQSSRTLVINGNINNVQYDIPLGFPKGIFFLSLYITVFKRIAMKRFLIPIMVLMVAIASCGNPGKGEKAAEVAEQATKAPEVEADSVGYIVKLGDMAPDFTCTLTDGKEVKLSDLKGKVVMLQFTASWCGVCRKEMPFIEKDIWLKHKDNPNFALIGIDRDEPLETVLKFAETTGVTYPLALDPGADIFAKYALRDAGITRNVLVDKEGKIVMMTRLYKPEEFATLVQTIEEMLK